MMYLRYLGILQGMWVCRDHARYRRYKVYLGVTSGLEGPLLVVFRGLKVETFEGPLRSSKQRTCLPHRL